MRPPSGAVSPFRWPTAMPAYDGGAAMHDIDDWVKQNGNRLLFVYGQWDPWTGGMFELGGATDSLRVIAPMAPHGAGIGDLTQGDRAAVLAKLAAWSGVTPDESQLARRARLGEPTKHVPPVILRMRQ